jgi:putative iron-dependent peroxidase
MTHPSSEQQSPKELQPVLGPVTSAAIFLVVTIEPGGESVVREVLTDLAGLQRSVGFRVPTGELRCTVGISSDAWDRLFGGERPAELHPFREVAGHEHRAVSTPGDVLFHLRAWQMDLCFELASQLMDRLEGAVTTVDEVHGFKYFEERDLLGFVDGTENPDGETARRAITVGDEDPEFAGGSYVLVQKYLHDMRSWNQLPVEAQEKVIGRTKLSNIELDDSVKPSNSHVALTTIVDPDGTERQIVRDNMPFGTIGRSEFGTYFIGYSGSPSVTEQMLENMFIGKPSGNYDRILDFSTAVTGSLFYVPTADFLDDLPEPPELQLAVVDVLPPSDGSLGIGELKGSIPQ